VKGTLLFYRPRRRTPDMVEFAVEPSRAELEHTVGARLETVAGFLSVEHLGIVRRCVAFADPEAKAKKAPLNVTATLLWDSALRRDFATSLLRADGARKDALFGTVAVLFLRTQRTRLIQEKVRAEDDPKKSHHALAPQGLQPL